jgi:nucleotidyltransferase/DNA polymerase involved in DNA repair
MIAYCHLPASQTFVIRLELFGKFQGVESWELDGLRGVYIQLTPWMGARMTQHLYAALRGTFGPRIRFGAAEQKTTARAAALYRPVPHCTIVTAKSVDRFLAELPIHLLPGLGQRTARFLERRGVRTFAAFRQLSTPILKEWFGVSGLILQQFAKGLDPRVVEPSRSFVSPPVLSVA